VIGLSAFVGAIAVGDLVKTTLGPKGMDKILQSAYEFTIHPLDTTFLFTFVDCLG
jgi:hypothetical protein